jgi:hypothetical protein
MDRADGRGVYPCLCPGTSVGLESYGLIGFASVMLALLMLFDLWLWYRDGVVVPLLLTAIAVAILKLVEPAGTLSRIGGLVWIVLRGVSDIARVGFFGAGCRQPLLDVLLRQILCQTSPTKTPTPGLALLLGNVEGRGDEGPLRTELTGHSLLK